MILSIPYAYTVVGFEPHRRKPVADRRAGVVEALVQDVPAGEAPVAAVWRRGARLEHRDGRTDILVRRIGDGLWVADSQAGRDPGRASPPGPSGEALLAAVAAADGEGNPFGHFHPGPFQGPRAGKVFRREVSSDREAVEAQVRARAAEVVAVDGVLHVRCPEPVLVRRGRAFDGFLSRVEVWWHSPHAYSQVDPADVYRLDEWPNLVADARREAAAMGVEDGFDLPDELDWFEVLDPDAFRLPLEASALGHAVAGLHASMGRVVRRCTEAGEAETRRTRGDEAGRDRLDWRAPYAVDVPEPALLEAYVGLGRMLAAGLDEPALDRVRAMMGGQGAGRFPGDDGDEVRRWKYSEVAESWDEVAAAFARWDARPARLRAPDPEADAVDMEALSALPG